MLDHVAGDESLLVALAGALSLPPETVAQANLVLNPPGDFGA